MDKFNDLWRSKSHEEKVELADKLDTSYVYLSQIANGHRKPGKHFRRELMRETKLPSSAFDADEVIVRA